MKMTLPKWKGFWFCQIHHSHVKHCAAYTSLLALSPASPWHVLAKQNKMKKNPLQGFGKRLKLHILLPLAYATILITGLIIKYLL